MILGLLFLLTKLFQNVQAGRAVPLTVYHSTGRKLFITSLLFLLNIYEKLLTDKKSRSIVSDIKKHIIPIYKVGI